MELATFITILILVMLFITLILWGIAITNVEHDENNWTQEDNEKI